MKMIVACDQYGGIAKDGNIPWKSKTDLQLFKLLTIGDTVIMGRKTFETLTKPLVDRFNIIVSNNDKEFGDNTATIHGRELTHIDNNTDWIIGGEQIYQLAFDLQIVTQVFVSRFTGNYECDQFIHIPDSFYKAVEIPFDTFVLEKWII